MHCHLQHKKKKKAGGHLGCVNHLQPDSAENKKQLRPFFPLSNNYCEILIWEKKKVAADKHNHMTLERRWEGRTEEPRNVENNMCSVSGCVWAEVESSLWIPACVSFSAEAKRRQDSGEDQRGSRGSEVTLEFLGNNREVKKNKNKGRRESLALCLCVSAAAGHLSLGATLVSWYNNMSQTIAPLAGDAIERWLRVQTGKHWKH